MTKLERRIRVLIGNLRHIKKIYKKLLCGRRTLSPDRYNKFTSYNINGLVTLRVRI